MPRLAKDQVKDREEFMKDIIRRDPKISMQKANDEFQKKFKSTMRPQRVYALKKMVTEELDKKGAGKTARPTMAPLRRDPENPPSNAGSQRLTLLEFENGDDIVARRVIELLRAKGLFTGEVASHGAGFVVVRMPD
jgi:hypothetical protein